eukprot:1192931-Prorocentrum_minimum.AAC.7
MLRQIALLIFVRNFTNCATARHDHPTYLLSAEFLTPRAAAAWRCANNDPEGDKLKAAILRENRHRWVRLSGVYVVSRLSEFRHSLQLRVGPYTARGRPIIIMI